MSNVDELLNELMSGSISTVSELKLRDESIQKKNQIKRFGRLKREQKKKSKLLVITELAIPFNPYSGKETEEYNRDNKFRPLISQSSLMKALKTFCDKEENAEVKQIYINKAGMEAWDTSNHEELTKEDKMIFRRYRVPRIFTLPVVRINIPSVTRSPYGREYMLSVQRDALTGQIVGEMPLPLRINKLQNDLCYQAVKKLEEEIKDGTVVLNDKDKKDRIRKIYEDVVVSSDYPLNYALAYEIPLDQSFKLNESVQLSGLEKEDIFSNIKLVKVTQEIQKALDNYMNGAYELVDFENDFWEFDMACQNDEDPMLLGKNTRYEKPMLAMKDATGSEDFRKAFANYLDEEKEMEKIFMGSAYVSKFTPELEPILLDAMREYISPEDDRMTEEVMKANQEIISEILDEEADELFAEIGMGTRDEGSLDEKESAKLGKENGLNINVDDILGADVGVEELDMELPMEE